MQLSDKQRDVMKKNREKLDERYERDRQNEVKRFNKILAYSERVHEELETMSPRELNLCSFFLGNICQKFDENYGLGTQLCLEWMLDHYIALELEKNAHPLLLKIMDFLQKNNHHERNKFYYFNDCEAFFVTPKKTDKTFLQPKTICVFGKSWENDTRFLTMDDPSDCIHNLYVRLIWRRSKPGLYRKERLTLSFYKNRNFNMAYSNDHTIYGDARDPGHVLTYQKWTYPKMEQQAKCDKVIWDINQPLRYFFEINTLHTQISELTNHS